MRTKKRLDHIVAQLYPNLSKNIIQSLIIQGRVKVEGSIVTKPGTMLPSEVSIELDQHEPKYVSRAGLKLEKALHEFHIDVTGLTILDAGISTGGFTDCLLQHGAAKIYGVDVGYGQVHEKISRDARVIILERTNLRALKTLPELVDMVTLDLSFISVLKVMEVVCRLLKPHGKLLVLIKPQFEAGKDQVGKGGIIKDPLIHQQVIDTVTQSIKNYGFILHGIIESPILGTTGNKEFLVYFSRE